MNYTSIAKDLNGLDTMTRRSYDALHAVRRVYAAGGELRTDHADSYLRSELSNLAARSSAPVELVQRGSLWWKHDAYALTPAGSRLLGSERASIKRLSTLTTNENLEEVLLAQGSSVSDYIVRSMMIVDGSFDGDGGKYFSRTARLGDAIVQKLNYRESRSRRSSRSARTSRSQPSSQTVYDGGTSDFLLYNSLHNSEQSSHSAPFQFGGGGVFDGGGAGRSFDTPVERSDSGWGFSHDSSSSSPSCGSSGDSGGSSCGGSSGCGGGGCGGGGD